jgi:hypothetical protein
MSQIEPAGIGVVGLVVVLDPDTASKLQGQFEKDTEGLTKTADEQGKKIGTNFRAGFVAAIAVGAVVLNEAFKIQDAFNIIQIQTGATGQAFEDLKDSALSVSQSADESFGEVASVVSDLNTRLGLTGPQLESIADQFLNLGQVSGVSTQTLTRDVTRLINDWGLATEDIEKYNDMLFRASQASGIGL